jgi:mono/diheme cytochrome c family protein
MTMAIFSFKGIAGVALGSFVLVSMSTVGLSQTKSGGSAEKGMKNPVKSTPQSIEAGEKAYKANCVPCHGSDAKGDGPVAKNMSVKPSDLTAPKLTHGSSDGEIFINIKEGIGPDMKMKAFKAKLSDQDIWNVVNYIHSLQAKK